MGVSTFDYLRKNLFLYVRDADFFATLFLLGAINWVAWIWWSKNEWILFLRPNGIDAWFWVISVLVGFFPLLLSIGGTLVFSSFTEKWVPVSPLGISFITSGIFMITFWYDGASYAYLWENYVADLFISLFATNALALLASGFVPVLYGKVVASEKKLNKKFFDVPLDAEVVAKEIRSEPLKDILHIDWNDELEEGGQVTKISSGSEREGILEFHIVVSPIKVVPQRAFLAIVAYKKGEFEIEPLDDFDVWVETKYAPIAKYLKDAHKVELTTQAGVLSEALRDKILKYNRGLLFRLSERVSIYLGRIIVAGLSIPALWYLSNTFPTQFTLVNDLTLFILIVAWQFGPLAWKRRKRV